MVERLYQLHHSLIGLNNRVGRGVSWLTLFMVLMTFAVAILRYLFDLGWIVMQESVIYLHAMVFMLGAGYTLAQDGHVRVDIFFRGCSVRTKAIIDLFGVLFLLFPVTIFLFWFSWAYVASSWAIMEGSREAGGLDLVWLLKGVMLVMPVLLFLQGLASLLGNILIVTDNMPQQG
ncbi:MAG: TRAP transporter small permease subunit [Magnetococcales bacterium]|nr:TRAP transporter small permease subunit [Magnetococcales bacterium]